MSTPRRALDLAAAPAAVTFAILGALPFAILGALPFAILAALPSPLPAQAVEDQERTGPSIVSGRIVDHESGRPIAGATVSLAPGQAGAAGAGTRVSGEDGRFSFDDVDAGSYVLGVTSLGYRTFENPLEVEPGSRIRMVVRLSVSPLELEPLVVVTARRPAFMDGFEERRARDRRHTGFFTREEIEERNPRDLAELFMSVPGTDVQPGLFGARLYVQANPARSARCRPDVWVNGYLMDFGDFPYEDVYPPEDVAAVELYALEHDVPQAFKGPHRCGALVIWLRELGPEEQPPAAWKRWIAALGILGATFILTR